MTRCYLWPLHGSLSLLSQRRCRKQRRDPKPIPRRRPQRREGFIRPERPFLSAQVAGLGNRRGRLDFTEKSIFSLLATSSKPTMLRHVKHETSNLRKRHVLFGAVKRRRTRIVKGVYLENPDVGMGQLIERLGRILLMLRRESQKTGRTSTPELVAAMHRVGRKKKKLNARPSDN
jgi:hypothetical protein